MKIKKITITNFRGIDSLSLDFTHPAGKPLDLVVLAGPNGCGKTSVLEACLIICGKKDLLGKRQDSKGNVRLGSKACEIIATLEDNGHEKKRNARGIIIKNGDFVWEPRLSDKLESFPIVYFSSWRAPELVGSVSLRIRGRAKRQKTTEESRLSEIKSKLVGLTALKAFPQKYPSKEKEIFAKIKKGWSIFYPDKDQEFVAGAASDPDIIGEVFDIFLVDTSGLRLPVDSLSSGEIEVFTMLGWFAIQDFSQGIILIDEPELHLHTSWHRAIMQALRTVLPTTQIICATHSPEILDQAYSYERFTILPEDDPRIRLVRKFKA